MTFLVVEDGTVVNNASGNAFALPLASTPQANDIAFVLIDCNNTNSISTVTGLGATWTIPTPYSSTSITYMFAIGVGATSSGNVSVTTANSRGGSGNVMLLRGGGANPVLTAGTPAGGFTGTNVVLTGPSQSVPGGAFVIARYGFQATGRTYSFPDTQTPAASFTSHGAISNSSTYDRAWATPSSAGTYQVTAKITSGTGGTSAVLGQWYLTTDAPATAVAQGAVSMSSSSTLTVSSTPLLVERVTTVTGGTALSISLTSTPLSGDVIVLEAGFRGGGGGLTGVSGCGATWTKVGTYSTMTPLNGDTSTNHHSIEVWIGRNPSAAGAITATSVISSAIGASANLVRGTDGSVSAVGQVVSGTLPWPGPSNVASAGQVVLAAAAAYDAGSSTFPSTGTLPSSGWTGAYIGLVSGWTRYSDASRIPVESSPTTHQTTITAAGTQALVVQTTVGSGSGTQSGAVAMSSTSSLTVAATTTAAAQGAVGMSSASTLTVAGTVTSAGVQGAAAMSSSSTLSAAGATSAAPAYQAAVLADSPGAYWRLNETDGSVLAYLSDTSGNARRLRVQAAATTLSQPGLISDGTSMRVGVNTSYVQTENSNSWSQVTAGDFTAECWIKILDTAPATSRAILDRANMNWGNDQWSIWWDPANGLRAFMGADSASHVVTWAKASSEAAVQAGGHLVVTRDGATATVRIYWNGTEVASGTGLASPFAVSRVVGIGCDMSGTSRISAYMDEVALYPGIRLSPTRIQAHYEAGAGAQGAASMSSSSTLTVGAAATSVAAVAMSSSSTLTAGASGGAPLAGAVDMQSTSTLAATAVESTQVGAVDMQSTSTMSVTAKATYVEQYRIPLGMTTLAFGRGSALLPYAGAESGSQALDFSIVTEAPASGLFVPQDGPADSRSEWIAITSSASQTLTVTVTAAFSVGIEVWDGDPSVDPLALSLVGSAAASTLDVAVATGQQLLIRVHPMTNATSGTGTVSWSMAARLDSGVLQFYAATEIFETPGWLPANVAAATPGGTLQFTLDSDPTVIYSGIADAQGLWVVSGVLLPALTVGTHSITVTDVASGQTGTRTFTVATVVPPTGTGVVPPPPTGPTYVQRWYLEDAGGEHYAFPINPSGMSSPHPTRAVIAEHTLSPTGRAILWEGIGDPTLWTITGAVETQAFYEALERFHKMQRRVYLTDHLARIWTVAFESLDLVEQKSAENDWAYTYTAKFLILDGPVTA